MASGGPILDISNLSKSFGGPSGTILALKKAFLPINKGEFVCLIGALGCGKSELLRLIGGFERPTAGSVKMWGMKVEEPGPSRGMVFQDYGLFPWLTVRSNIAFGPKARKMPRGQALKTADRFMEMVGLSQFANSYPHQLS